MRMLLFSCGLLVLANTVLFLWPDSASTAAHIYSVKDEVNPHFIRLNKEIEDRYLDTIPATGRGVEFRLAASNGAICYRLGPFMHRANYELAQAVLFNANVEYQKSTRKAKQSGVYRVFLGPFASQAKALDKRSELRKKRILDHFVRKQDDGGFIVSLGIYATKQSATKALSLFGGVLDSVKMAQEVLLLPDSYWLHFAIQDGNHLQEELAFMDWGEQSSKLGKYKCRSAPDDSV